MAESISKLNVDDGETVHQSALLLTGQCSNTGDSSDDFVAIKCYGSLQEDPTQQNWPATHGHWKAMVILAPGSNQLTIEHRCPDGRSESKSLTINYLPLLQLPPLHLAIMVAKDSPLIIDCPPAKYGAISTAHSSLDAAIQKFRVTAYMWQAMTAEDLRQKDLGRRSFRLDEEWAMSTTERIDHLQHLPSPRMCAVPKVHIIRSEKTVAEIRQYSSDPRLIYECFRSALGAYGGPFVANCRPVVAGLLLDSRYSPNENNHSYHCPLIYPSADGQACGIFGSHLTYSWPRFLEEIPACLIDLTQAGSSFAPDNDQSIRMADACYISQSAFLHEVGHALGADHTKGIMSLEDSRNWSQNFLGDATTRSDGDDAMWSLEDALRFKLQPQFRLPGDTRVTPEFIRSTASFEPVFRDEEPEAIETLDDGLVIRCKSSGIAQISITQEGDTTTTNLIPNKTHPDIHHEHLIPSFSNYDSELPVRVEVLALSGKTSTLDNVWAFFASKPFIRVPNTSVILRKRSTRAPYLENPLGHNQVADKTSWTVMLHKRSRPNGPIIRATSIDLRVGATFDGGVVYYADDTRAHCGPTHLTRGGARIQRVHTFGGHASERHDIPDGRTIVKLEIQRDHSLNGIRMTLDDGEAWGYLNNQYRRDGEIVVLEPEDGHTIVGLYGLSEPGNGFACEFGIITAKDGFVPEVVYDMPEMQNIVVAER